jgi:hypothetical protein
MSKKKIEKKVKSQDSMGQFLFFCTPIALALGQF